MSTPPFFQTSIPERSMRSSYQSPGSIDTAIALLYDRNDDGLRARRPLERPQRTVSDLEGVTAATVDGRFARGSVPGGHDRHGGRSCPGGYSGGKRTRLRDSGCSAPGDEHRRVQWG